MCYPINGGYVYSPYGETPEGQKFFNQENQGVESSEGSQNPNFDMYCELADSGLPKDFVDDFYGWPNATYNLEKEGDKFIETLQTPGSSGWTDYELEYDNKTNNVSYKLVNFFNEDNKGSDRTTSVYYNYDCDDTFDDEYVNYYTVNNGNDVTYNGSKRVIAHGVNDERIFEQEAGEDKIYFLDDMSEVRPFERHA